MKEGTGRGRAERPLGTPWWFCFSGNRQLSKFEDKEETKEGRQGKGNLNSVKEAAGGLVLGERWGWGWERRETGGPARRSSSQNRGIAIQFCGCER